jgi:hypothetical protein
VPRDRRRPTVVVMVSREHQSDLLVNARTIHELYIVVYALAQQVVRERDDISPARDDVAGRCALERAP